MNESIHQAFMHVSRTHPTRDVFAIMLVESGTVAKTRNDKMNAGRKYAPGRTTGHARKRIQAVVIRPCDQSDRMPDAGVEGILDRLVNRPAERSICHSCDLNALWAPRVNSP